MPCRVVLPRRSSANGPEYARADDGPDAEHDQIARSERPFQGVRAVSRDQQL
jgi:hypothetical protein